MGAHITKSHDQSLADEVLLNASGAVQAHAGSIKQLLQLSYSEFEQQIDSLNTL